MLASRTLSIAIGREWRAAYQAVWRPQDFPKWARGLSVAPLEPAGDGWWKTRGPAGPVRIRFTAHNGFGIMDHHVEAGGGAEIYVPMRIVANGEGAEVLFTLFRQPGMSDEIFARDAEWVARDLAALKALVETGSD